MSPQELAEKVGQQIGTSEWVEMSQDRINKFADATGDHQFIHIDEEKAKMTPFGGTIAHGFLTLSMIPYLGAKSDMPKIDGVKMGVNYGGNKTRFISPVRSGKRIRGHWKLVEMIEKLYEPARTSSIFPFQPTVEFFLHPVKIANIARGVFPLRRAWPPSASPGPLATPGRRLELTRSLLPPT